MEKSPYAFAAVLPILLLILLLMRTSFQKRVRRAEKDLLSRSLADTALPYVDLLTPILWLLDCLSEKTDEEIKVRLGFETPRWTKEGKKEWRKLNKIPGDISCLLNQIASRPRTPSDATRIREMKKFLEIVCDRVLGVGVAETKRQDLLRRFRNVWIRGPVGYHMSTQPISHSTALVAASELVWITPMNLNLKGISPATRLLRIGGQLYGVVCKSFEQSDSRGLVSREYTLFCYETGTIRYLTISGSLQVNEVYLSIDNVVPSSIGVTDFNRLPNTFVLGDTIMYPVVGDENGTEAQTYVRMYRLSGSGPVTFGSADIGFEDVETATWTYGNYRISVVWFPDGRVVATHEECITLPDAAKPQPITIIA